MRYLATPIDRLAPSYDVVIVGSGYGGAIAASRLSRAGLRVCVLERGDEYQPGDFPESPTEGMAQFQLDLPERRIGSPTGLLDVHVNPDISVVSGCGLGGTSLVNANVAIEPDPRAWDDPIWPAAVRADMHSRIPDGFAHAREMLRPAPFPDALDAPKKLVALERSAKHMNARSYRVPIAVNFEAGVNHVGVEQPACNNCGNCVGGCNHGAKNTLVTNYLPDAVNHGAEIFTRTRVTHVERRGTRWVCRFQLLEAGHASFQAAGMLVTADTVILAAGSLGSTEILLRSREMGLSVSDRLGAGFTGNGDVLGFAYNADDPIECVGVGSARGCNGPGPCITGVIDLRDRDELNQGMVIQEGSLPSSLGPVLAASMFLAARFVGRDTDTGYMDFAQEKIREMQALIPGGSTGAIGNTQTFLVMAHDDSQGRIRLVDDRVRIDWPGVGSQPIFNDIDRELVRATEAVGGTYIKNPLWSRLGGKSLVTVHPLGGCGMGETAENGVVDHRGAVFAGTSGDAVHDGLYVCDGSIIPRSLGVNPFLTISALAERACAIMAEERGLAIDYALPSRPRTAMTVQRVGVQFTETMRGFFAADAELDFGAAAAAGEAAGSPFEFTLTVACDDLDAMLGSPEHQARLYGVVNAPAVSPEPLTVTNGIFELLTAAEDEVRGRRMTYHMPLTAADGRRFHVHGYKRVHDDRGLDLWADTTTLFVTMYEGEGTAGPVVGRGILRILPRDFARQMRTFKITGAGSLARRLRAAADFGRFFAGSLYDTYGGVFATRTALDPTAEPRTRRELRTDPPEVHAVTTGDGLRLHLTRYYGGTGEPVLLLPGLGVAGSAFAMDTIDVNLVEYLCEAGRDVWVADHRGSLDMGGAQVRFDADHVALQDIPAIVATALRVSQAQMLDVVAMGFGATTLLMSLVEGLPGVRSAVCCQGGLHVEVPRASRSKAGLHLPSVLRAFGKQTIGAGGGPGSWKSRLFDAGLRVLPVEAEEWCTSNVCRRITFMYGHSYEHDQVNRATHEALHEVFGVVNLTLFAHMAQMVRAHAAVAINGTSYLRNLERLAMPITFLHGGDNACYLPESTLATARTLSDANGAAFYRHAVIPDYGHTDFIIGKRAVQDVFPLILAHLRMVEQGSAPLQIQV